MFKGKKNVHFDEYSLEPTTDDFYREFNKKNTNPLWVALIFLLSSSIQFCISLDASAIMLTSNSEVSCSVHVYSFINWTRNEIRTLLYPPLKFACMRYAFNLSLMENYTYQQAYEITQSMNNPPYKLCSLPLDYKYFSRDKLFLGTCKSYRFKDRIDAIQSVGTTFAYIIIGLLSDLYGRKFGFHMGLAFWMTATFILPVIDDFGMAQAMYFVKGFGKAGIKLTGLILFMELCNKNYRGILTVYITSLGPLGTITGITLKQGFRGPGINLEYLVAIPSLILVFYAWYVPESPRWNLSYGRKRRAWKFLNTLGTDISDLIFLPSIKYSKRKVLSENLSYVFSSVKFRKSMCLCAFLLAFILCLMNSKKKYLTLRSLQASSHTFLISIAEMSSCMYVLPPLIMLGRHLALVWFFSLTLVKLFIALLVSEVAYYVCNILTVLTVHTSEVILFLYISEIFPTSSRGTCTGMVCSVAHTFFLLHDFYQDTTILSLTTENAVYVMYIISGLIVLTALPYTGGTELPDFKVYRQ